MQPELKVELGIVQRRLPWIIGAFAFVVYLVTLNHSATFEGISALARAAGWDWRTNVVAPLHVIMTFWVRWLPGGMQLVGLNLTAAVCASLALVLLARSVALLPHDRTREQRALERNDYSLLSIRAAWLPPVLAALVCGFQLSFWENAVVASGEALDVLIFAWLVHELLQYRLDGKESRLSRFTFVYGLAVTNNFAMIWFFVPFLLALIWIKGVGFFNWRFLLRMTLCGLLGLLLYLLLPAVGSINDPNDSTFWELLKSYWGFQRESMGALPKFIILMVSLTSVLPVLFIGIRWPAQFGETSALGNALTNLMTHVIHLVFLVAALYVAFDPLFSPRVLSGQAFAFLPLYFLGALSIGYCAGYFLLVFGAKPGLQAWQRPSPLRRIASSALVALVWVALVAAPCGLLVKNFPIIWSNEGRPMKRWSELAVKSLPDKPSFILSDDVFQLFAFKDELRKAQPDSKHVLVDTASLKSAGYHRVQGRKASHLWPKFTKEPEPKALIPDADLVQMLFEMSKAAPVYYLQPSFGYYFEFFYLKPHHALYELATYPSNSIARLAATAAELKEQDGFWKSLKSTEIEPRIQKADPFVKIRPGKQRPKPRTVQTFLNERYSRMLNHFGVEVQKAGNMELAGEYFDLAVRCNPANPAAFQNLEFNRARREGRKTDDMSEEVIERLKYFGGRLDAVLGSGGPVDAPGACVVLAGAFSQGRNFRQAAQYMERAVQLDPDQRLWVLRSASMLVDARSADKALERIAQFRAKFQNITEDEELELLRAEAWAMTFKGNLAGAEQLLVAARSKYPQKEAPWDTQVDIYLRTGQNTNALAVLNEQLKALPNSVRALINFGVLNLYANKPAEALPYFERAVRINPKHEEALLNRALANKALGRFDAAIADLQALLAQGTSTYRVGVFYQLAETQFQKKNRKESLRYYREFLKAAPQGTPEVATVKERIKVLESGTAL